MALTVNNLNNGMVSIPFTRELGAQTYSDAIVLSQKEYEQLTEEQIVAMMDQRFVKWYQMITFGIEIEKPVAEEVIVPEEPSIVTEEPVANTDNTAL